MREMPLAPWTDAFYQLANRLAHLHFLRTQWGRLGSYWSISLVTATMEGPASAGEWQAAYKVAWHVLGIPDQNPLQKYILHIYPDVADLSGLG